MSESRDTPTVVLVHGGFADASFWAPVIEDLQAHNVPVLAPPNPLRGLAHDAEYVAELRQPDRRAGAAGRPLVRRRRDLRRGRQHAQRGRPGLHRGVRARRGRVVRRDLRPSSATRRWSGAVRPGSYPLADGETAVELTIAPELYREAFAADLSEDVTRRPGGQPASLRRDLRGSRRRRPPGRRCRRGRSSRPRTTPFRRTPSDTWPSVPARRRSRWTRRTRSRSRSRLRLRT